ncbi:hypothetical protein BEWA_008450 [Theileria equi strain WA]|uniref:Uncharacterized protein n=1 Tax=Theileria equi strain WA TaxID=1537102 RepID=L0B0V3_THEEQ|nr:hypothetical protein BEWA_008450 [Theileria equi strain WA]AFZ81435.1 hypothetical protein BEWA_008450 [Theileria equi strain WA]|eukprot:XP_004831101.1 hypothetical protein BEWA_008450 [Theileria equi strain WA]
MSPDKYNLADKPQDFVSSQSVPFRRNSLLHMIGSFGAGTSAPTSRSNLKRHRSDN